jgi:uncharacterized protein (UPF0262 family)
MAEGPPRHFLDAVVIDEVSLAPASPEQEHERKIAISDLLGANSFEPADAPGGPYRLKIALVENRLDLDISGPDYAMRHMLSLAPFRRIVRDYLAICQSYYEAIRNATPGQIESIDMGRRGLHNEGSDLLRERLEGKVRLDAATSRRLFTLICALHWRG